MPSQQIAILVTLLLYKVALIVIGLLCRRLTHDPVDFYLGGRRLGAWVAAISASASSSSAWTLLGVSGAAYAWGLSAVWLFPSCVGGFLINWFLLAKPLQRLSHREQAVTVLELLAGGRDTRWNASLRITGAVIVLVSLGTYIASQFQGAGKTFSETFELPLWESVLIGAAIVVFYTLLGGFWAVSITDTVQGSLMAGAALLVPLAALISVGGPSALVHQIAAHPDPSFASLTGNLPMASAVGFVLGLLGIGLGYPGQPHVVNRFMALRDKPGVLARARSIAIAWAVVVYSGMLVAGWCGRFLVSSLEDPEVILIALSTQLFNPVVAGLILAALLSAIMSTVDSQLLVASSTVSHDLGIGLTKRLSPLGQSRLIMVAVSTAAVAAALVGSQEIFSRVLFAWAAMGSAFGPLLLVLAAGRTVPPLSRLLAQWMGFGLSVSAYYLAEGPWKGSLERFFPFLLVFVMVLLSSRRVKTSSGAIESSPRSLA